MVELVWEGKYDASGNRIAPMRVSLPFQSVETVNESAQERQRSLDMFAGGRDPEWRNRLIWGDKKYVNRPGFPGGSDVPRGGSSCSFGPFERRVRHGREPTHGSRPVA